MRWLTYLLWTVMALLPLSILSDNANAQSESAEGSAEVAIIVNGRVFKAHQPGTFSIVEAGNTGELFLEIQGAGGSQYILLAPVGMAPRRTPAMERIRRAPAIDGPALVAPNDAN